MKWNLSNLEFVHTYIMIIINTHSIWSEPYTHNLHSHLDKNKLFSKRCAMLEHSWMNFGLCQDSSCAIREVRMGIPGWLAFWESKSVIWQISLALSVLLELWVDTTDQQHIPQNQIKIRNPVFFVWSHLDRWKGKDLGRAHQMNPINPTQQDNQPKKTQWLEMIGGSLEAPRFTGGKTQACRLRSECRMLEVQHGQSWQPKNYGSFAS